MFIECPSAVLWTLYPLYTIACMHLTNYSARVATIFFIFVSLLSSIKIVVQSLKLCPTLCDSGSFPGSSAGKDSACNAGDLGSIPGWRRSAGEGLGYPLQCSWASLVAQLVKNLPTIRET